MRVYFADEEKEKEEETVEINKEAIEALSNNK